MKQKPGKRQVSVVVAKPSATATDALYREGVAAQKRGDLRAAEESIQKVLADQPAHLNALQMLGIINAQRGRPAEAEQLFARALAVQPDDPSIHNNRANVLCVLRRYEEAAQHFERAIALNPVYPDAHANLGKALLDQGQTEAALPHFDRAIKLMPDFVEALFQRGLVLVKLGRETEALDSFDRTLKVRPGHADTHLNRGNLLRKAGKIEQALISFERAIAANPGYAEAHCNRGNTLHAMKFLPDSLASLDRAIALKPDMALAHCSRGGVLADMGRTQEAIDAFDRGIGLQPDLAEAHANRGLALRGIGRLHEAMAAFDRAIALRPDFPGAHANRAVTLTDVGRYDEALAALDRALAIDPERADFYNIRGNILQGVNRHDDALREYAKARQLKPDFGEAEWNESVCRLLYGDFDKGWPLFESRWRNGQALGDLKLAQPLWNGRPVQGGLLVWGEQGIGDQIHHLGMIDALGGLASQVIVAVNERLLPLVSRSFPAMRVIPLNAAVRENCAMQTPAGSLGLHLRRSTDDFPLKRKAYLRADPARVAKMKKTIAAGRRLLCGLSWRSAAPKVGTAKSIALRDLAPLLELEDMRFVDLQYGDTAVERQAVQAATGVEVRHVDAVDNRQDLDGLAALISACDVVVTISNTTAHLAGALGIPTLLMLPTGVARHWYWHEGRVDSPWYPSMKIFRQRAVADWGGVFAEVGEALQAYSSKRKH
jgi:tetratricopeptide (TPR) repeat protein